MLGAYAQQGNQNSTNHILVGLNANVTSFNNQNKTIPMSYGISPFVTYLHNRFGYSLSVGWSAFDDQWKTAPECTRYYHWNEVNLSGLVSFRVVSKPKTISLSVFCGPSIDFLTNYRVKIVSKYDTTTLNTNEAAADYNFCGIDIMTGMSVSFHISNKLYADLSPFFKLKVLNEIRDDNYPRLPLIVHPVIFYGASFSICYQLK